MEVVAAVVGGLMSCLCSSNGATRSAAQICKHVISPTKEIESLRNKLAELIARKNDVERRLHNDEVVEGKTPTDDAKHWLEVVEKILTQMIVVEDQVKEAKTCLKGLLPDCCSRSKLGHCISKLTIEVVDLSEKGGHFLDGSFPLSLPNPNKGTRLPTTKLVGKTAATNMKMVWERLLDPDVGKIGVYGMGGAGKTSVVKEVNNRLAKEHLFDKVIWATVSKDASVQKLQNYIAKALGQRLADEDDEVYRSASLLDSLQRNKKFVLILDDMWDVFPLHVIGIPEPTKKNGCKIILTSRSKEVCRRMGCQGNDIVRMNLLLEDEAWELLMNKVGVHLGEKTKVIAKDVIKECANLPLAIITIGGVMQGNNDISEWRATLKDLRESSYQIPDMEEKVFKCLIFSYERLASEQLKSCFLYCTLYPEDYTINEGELVGYWIVEGLIRENSRQAELDKGQVILNRLKHHCLLESGNKDGVKYGVKYVKLHDLMREMALYIAKDRFIVRTGSMLEEIENGEEWGEDLERASFMESKKVTKILVTPKCPKLSTLFLNQMQQFYSMPPDLFVHMKGLKVLNLENNGKIKTLPDSISNLVNLRVLNLSCCYNIVHIPSLAKLTLLRTLILSDTSIGELPHGMEMLVNLKCLILSRIWCLGGKFPIGVIPKWSLLEKLCWFSKPIKLYEVEGEMVLAKELLSLKHLEALAFHFICASAFNRYVGSPAFKSLKMFDLGIGTGYEGATFLERMVTICETDSPGHVLIIPKNTEILRVGGLKKLMSLNQFLTRLNELEVRRCEISMCEDMEYVLSFSQEEEKGTEGILLPCLEELQMTFCSKLESLCKGIPTPGSLRYLKKLHIKNCHNMKNVFSSPRLLQLLQQLECIDIEKCSEMEELIASEEEEEDISSIPTISLPMLKVLSVWNLSKLKSISKGGMVCNSLQRLQIYKCAELKKLPQLSAPSLREFTGRTKRWWDSLEWDDDNTALQTLFPL